MEMTDLIWGTVTAAASAVSGFIGGRLERKKQSKEIDLLDMTNLKEGFAVYKDLLNDLEDRFRKTLSDNASSHDLELKEVNRRMDGHAQKVLEMTEAHRACESKYDKIVAHLHQAGVDFTGLFQ